MKLFFSYGSIEIVVYGLLLLSMQNKYKESTDVERLYISLHTAIPW